MMRYPWALTPGVGPEKSQSSLCLLRLKEKEALTPLPITHKDTKGPSLGRQRSSCLQQH